MTHATDVDIANHKQRFTTAKLIPCDAQHSLLARLRPPPTQ